MVLILSQYVIKLQDDDTGHIHISLEAKKLYSPTSFNNFPSNLKHMDNCTIVYNEMLQWQKCKGESYNVTFDSRLVSKSWRRRGLSDVMEYGYVYLHNVGREWERRRRI